MPDGRYDIVAFDYSFRPPQHKPDPESDFPSTEIEGHGFMERFRWFSGKTQLGVSQEGYVLLQQKRFCRKQLQRFFTI